MKGKDHHQLARLSFACFRLEPREHVGEAARGGGLGLVFRPLDRTHGGLIRTWRIVGMITSPPRRRRRLTAE
jgi:hypothetical protein